MKVDGGSVEIESKLSAVAECGCRRCIEERGDTINGLPRLVGEMVVCTRCGSKRCPHAADHRHSCTDSNEPGQLGSAYGRPLCPGCQNPGECTATQVCATSQADGTGGQVSMRGIVRLSSGDEGDTIQVLRRPEAAQTPEEATP